MYRCRRHRQSQHEPESASVTASLLRQHNVRLAPAHQPHSADDSPNRGNLHVQTLSCLQHRTPSTGPHSSVRIAIPSRPQDLTLFIPRGGNESVSLSHPYSGSLMLARPLARPLIGRAVWRRRLFISRARRVDRANMRFSRGAHARGNENVAHAGWGPASFLLAWLVRIWYEHTVRLRSWVRVSPTCSRGWSWYPVPDCWAARLDGSAVLWVGNRAYLADWRRCIHRIVVDAGTGSHATDGKVRSDRPSNPLLTMHPSIRLPVVGLLLLVLSIEAWWGTNRPGI
jgi:hypothetical protein